MVDGFPISLLQTLADGMRRGTLGQGRQFHQHLLFLLVGLVGIVDVVHGSHFEDAQSERSSLVEHNGLYL